MVHRLSILIAVLAALAIILAAVLFMDFDGDGLTNVTEFRLGTDFNNPDSDGDGLSDGLEVNTCGTNPLIADTDGDNLSDGLEVNTHGTNPLLVDTDNDGLEDGLEINTHKTNPLSDDTDNDNLSDGSEVDTYRTNPLVMDTDSDGISDGLEVNVHGTDPLDNDTDNDWLLDGQEINGWVATINGQTCPITSNPFSQDSDGDNLSDWCEYHTYGSNPKSADSDNDGFGDSLEIIYATDLADASSVPTLLENGPQHPYLFLEVDYTTGCCPSQEALDYFESHFEWELGVEVEIITDEVTPSELEAIGVSPDSLGQSEFAQIEGHFHYNPTTHLYVFYAKTFDEENTGGLAWSNAGVFLNGEYVLANIARERTVLLHEVGHCLGLEHCTNPICAMQTEAIFSNPVYCSTCWSQRNLLDKWSVDEPWS